jgi:hypothetical protein
MALGAQPANPEFGLENVIYDAGETKQGTKVIGMRNAANWQRVVFVRLQTYMYLAGPSLVSDSL